MFPSEKASDAFGVSERSTVGAESYIIHITCNQALRKVIHNFKHTFK